MNKKRKRDIVLVGLVLLFSVPILVGFVVAGIKYCYRFGKNDLWDLVIEYTR
jgi:hypothetical protein